MDKAPFLIETALLTHGLGEIGNDQLLCSFPEDDPYFAWMENGEIVIDGINRFLPFRDKGSEVSRIDHSTLAQAMEQKLTGAFTASATMAVANQFGIKFAVTAGMGGLFAYQPDDDCQDLLALRDLPVILIATSPKDVFDTEKTIQWLKTRFIPIYGSQNENCNGFLFLGPKVKLDGILPQILPAGSCLILNGIAADQRLNDTSWLEDATETGWHSKLEGSMFHPAVNKALDFLSDGRSGQLQLQALVNNIRLARHLYNSFATDSEA